MEKQNAAYTCSRILFTETESRMLVTRAGGEGGGEKEGCYLVGIEFQICKMRVLEVCLTII